MTIYTMRFLLVGVLLLAILAAAYRPKLLPLVAIGGFIAFYGPLAAGRVQTWNVFHYWLNTKYLNELGFTDLYACAVEADPAKFGPIARNLETYEYEPITQLEPCPRSNFTARRWQEFAGDLRWLKSQPGRDLLWAGTIRDKGLNTTPTWLALFGPLAGMFPAGSVGWWGLLNADFIALIAALILVGITRGPQTAGLMGIFLLTWIGTVPQLMGHWFQWVWLALCLVALAAWHTKWYALAGGSLALAAALAIFPAVLFAYPVIHFGRVPRRFWKGAAAVGGLALAAGFFTPLGWQVWPEWIEKMARHSGHIVMEPGNFGLRNLVIMAADPAGALAVWQAFAMGEIGGMALTAVPAWSWLPVLVLAALALLNIRKQQKMTFGGAMPLLFSSLTLSRYYYAIFALTFDEADQNEAITLLLISLVFFVLHYWLDPAVAYAVGQFVLLVYLYRKVIK